MSVFAALALVHCSGDRSSPVDDSGASGYRLVPVVEGLEHPWGLAFVSPDTMLVTERPGRLRVIRDGLLLSEPVSGLPQPLVERQGGYLDIALDPEFAVNRRAYLSFAKGTKDENRTAVISTRLSDSLMAATDVELLFEADFAKSAGLHFGSRFAFLPDNSIVFGLGEGFHYREEAQNLGNHLGSSIRINRDGSIPADNPLVDVAGARDEIYTYGHRNMQGIAYDGATGTLFAVEHGPRGGDELNILKPGANYGWPLASHGINYSGSPVSDRVHVEGTEPPLTHWTPSISVSAIAVYRGEAFPEMDGELLVSSLTAGEIRRLRVQDGRVVAQEVMLQADRRLRMVAVSPFDGAIYVLTDDGDDGVYRVERR